MKRNRAGFSTVQILGILVTIGIIGAIGGFIYSHQHTSPPTSNQQKGPATLDEVKSTADAFLISQVGKDRLEKYYTFDKDQSADSDSRHSPYDFMAYHFSPLKAIAETDVIMVQVNRNNLKEVLADSVPNCVENKSLCDFNVSRDQALAIAKNNSLTDSDLGVGWLTKHDEYAKKAGLPFVIVVSSCSQNKSIYIDYRNGNVLGIENRCGDLD